MANNIQISDLTFDGIRSSLVNYLKQQDTFTDYNFEGSGIRTLLDLLAYNTFYYAYYANMMANEMFLDTAKLENSMISLTKPLGYVVSSYTSAKATVRLNNVNSAVSSLSPFSVFRGTDIAGRPYFFYNTRSIRTGVNASSPGTYQTDYFEVYEGKAATIRQLVSVDLTTQSFSLPGIEIDPRTILIEVGDANGNNLISWDSYLLNPDSVVGPDTEVFFVERTKTGYNVNFGRYTSNDIGNLSTGKQITDQNTVYVSYLVSSGSAGNGVANITFVSDARNQQIATATTSTEISVVARGGVSTPDLDEIRFFAPKSFARQNRLVTKNDYYAILNELGYGSGGLPEFTYKVFGGEEATPPAYGRVFVSIIGLSDSTSFTQANEINEVLSVLKSKSVVSILPEYLPPIEMGVILEINATHPDSGVVTINGQIKQAIRTALKTAYGTKKYDNSIIEQSVIEIIRAAYSGVQVTSSGVFLTVRAIMPSSTISNERKMNFKSELSSVSLSGFGGSVTAQNNGKYLYLSSSANASPVGEVDLINGVVTIYPNITTNELTIDAKFPNDNFIAKDEIVSYIKNSETDITITL
jgi:hypothetical protein